MMQPLVSVLLLATAVVLTAASLFSGSCQGRCGPGTDKGFSCQCNNFCGKYHDCCDDYLLFCQRESDTCQGRCGSGLNKKFSCQCNVHCVKHKDCCSDYSAVCSSQTSSGASQTTGGASQASSGTSGGSQPSSNCKSFSQITEELWAKDVDRLSPDDVIINYGTQMEDSSYIRDQSPQKLFSYVNENRLSGPVYETFLDLLDNYIPDKNKAEYVTPAETDEEDAFLDAILSTETGQTLYEYLLCEGKVQDMGDMKTTLRRIWFDLYPRSGSSSILDTSGFEHVMVGEFKSSTKVNGMHSWLAFYEKEKNGDIDYYGHTCGIHTNKMCAAFDWVGRKKQLASFFINVSPAFDIAIYSVCFIMHPGTCHVVVDGERMDIQSYSLKGHITTAFITKY